MKPTVFSAVVGSLLMTSAVALAAQPMPQATPAPSTTPSPPSNYSNTARPMATPNDAAHLNMSDSAGNQTNANYNSRANWHSSSQSAQGWLPPSAMPHPQHQGNVTFVSGGVGMGNREAMRRMAPDYNLRLIFAVEHSGNYLSDVDVRLINAQGQDVLNTKSHGPLFYAHLAPGHYKVSVSSDGKTQTRRINISTRGVAAQSFYWRSPQAS